jgi:hypothetical protein
VFSGYFDLVAYIVVYSILPVLTVNVQHCHMEDPPCVGILVVAQFVNFKTVSRIARAAGCHTQAATSNNMPIIEKIKEKVLPQHNNAAAQPTVPPTSNSAGSSAGSSTTHMLMPGDRQHSNNLDDSQHHDSRTTGVTHGFAGRLKDAATGAF